MSVEKLERVLWRLRKRCPDNNYPKWNELTRCIMYECGTDPLTVRNNRKALVTLGWIVTLKGRKVRLTGNDLTGDD